MKLNALADALFEAVGKENRENGAGIYDLCLYRDGEWEERSFTEIPSALNVQSVAKNVIATGIGFLVCEGRLGLHETVADLFGDAVPASTREGYGRVTVHHLLTQTSGIDRGFLWSGAEGEDWLTPALSEPLVHGPGSKFCYSNSHYYILSRILSSRCPEGSEQFLRDRLFTPLGITHWAMECCPMGHVFGGAGLYLGARDLCMLGVGYLEGKTIPGRWIEMATRPQTDLLPYGYSFWLRPHSYGMNGVGGQIVEVFPEVGLVASCRGGGGRGCMLANLTSEILGL